MPRQSDAGTMEFIKSYAVDVADKGQMNADQDTQVFDDTNQTSAQGYNSVHGDTTSGARNGGD